jgi:tRNA U34 5-carboxymethylaminomethyl modifying enzyme MnmG/GidA
MVVELSNYVYKKNKKKFDYIEISYTNNLNIIKLLDVNIKTVLSESYCSNIEEFGDKLIENTKKFEKLCKFEDDKNKNKEIIRKLKENQLNYNSKLFKVLSSLNIKMDNNLEVSISQFNQKYKEYLEIRRKYDEFMYEFNNLREEYKNKNKYYEKIWLEINT